ncbi:MAG: hypothetical protein VW057_06180 [Rhodospirillaceae bacterium]
MHNFLHKLYFFRPKINKALLFKPLQNGGYCNQTVIFFARYEIACAAANHVVALAARSQQAGSGREGGKIAVYAREKKNNFF